MGSLVLIVEDHAPLRALLRDWLAMALSPDHVVEATDSLEAVERAATLRPQVVIVDLDGQRTNGHETLRRIKAAVPGARLVALALHDDRHHRADAARAGAGAYVAKSVLQAELVPVVEALLVQRRA